MVGWQKNPVRAGRRTGPVHDLAWLAASYEIDPVEPGAASFLSSRASAVSPPPAASGTGDTSKLRGSTVEHCVVTKDFAERVGLGPDVVGSLVQLFESGTAAAGPIVSPANLSRFRLVSFSSRTWWCRSIARAASRRRSPWRDSAKGSVRSRPRGPVLWALGADPRRGGGAQQLVCGSGCGAGLADLAHGR
jgi:hypothetical protein